MPGTVNGGMYTRTESWFPPAHVRGGLKRAATADRDLQGRLMPADKGYWSSWQLDSDHGRSGGMVRAAAAARDERGRFVAATKESAS